MFRSSMPAPAAALLALLLAPAASGHEPLRALRAELAQELDTITRGVPPPVAARAAGPERAVHASAAISPKQAALEALLDTLRTLPPTARAALRRDRARFAAAAPTVWRPAAGGVGGSCAAPIEALGESALRLELDGHTAAWIRWRAPADGIYRIATDSTSMDPLLTVFDDCGDASPRARQDDGFGLDAELALQAQAGQAFLLRVEDASGDAGELALAADTTPSISGRITDAVTGAPLPNIRVEAFRDGYFSGSGGGTDQNGNYTVFLYSSTTAGDYRVRTGEWSSQVRPLLHEAWPDAPCRDSDYFRIDRCAPGSTLRLQPGQSAAGIDIALGSGAGARGRVHDRTSGLPVAGSLVELLDAQGVVRSVTSDEAGRFSVWGLVPGVSHYAMVSSTGHRAQLHAGVDCPSQSTCGTAGGTPILTVDREQKVVDFDLEAQSYIEVDLALADGSSFNRWDGQLQLYYANGVRVDVYSEWREGGPHRIGPLPPGNYLLNGRVRYRSFPQWHGGIDCATDCVAERALAQPITIAGPGEIPRVAMSLTPYPSMEGRVTAAATTLPVAAARIELRPSASPSAVSYYDDVDADGRYRIPAVAPGEYLVRVKSSRYVDQMYPAVECESATPGTSCPSAQSLSFGKASGNRSADFQLRLAPTLSGQLFAGQPLVPSGVTYYYTPVGLYAGSQSDAVAATLAIDAQAGRYTLSDFAPGTYFVGAKLGGFFGQVTNGVECEATADGYYMPPCNWAAATAHALGTSDAVIDFSLRRSGRAVRVTRTGGQPLAGVALDLWSESGLRLHTVVTGADGRAMLQFGSFYDSFPVRLSTDNYLGLLDEVYPDLPCAYGTSVYRGGCSLAGAAVLTMPVKDPTLPELQIVLDVPPQVFGSGFE